MTQPVQSYADRYVYGVRDLMLRMETERAASLETDEEMTVSVVVEEIAKHDRCLRHTQTHELQTDVRVFRVYEVWTGGCGGKYCCGELVISANIQKFSYEVVVSA